MPDAFASQPNRLHLLLESSLRPEGFRGFHRFTCMFRINLLFSRTTEGSRAHRFMQDATTRRAKPPP
jgi:hypothetical protein